MSCPQIKSYTDKCLWNGNLPNNHLRPDRTLWQRNAEFFVKVYVILRFYAFLRYTLAIKRLFFRQSLRAWSPWLQIPVSRAFMAASRECKQVSIPLDLHLNSDLSILSYDFHPRVAIICSPKVEPTNLKFSVTKRILSIAKVIRFPSLREIPLLWYRQ